MSDRSQERPAAKCPRCGEPKARHVFGNSTSCVIASEPRAAEGYVRRGAAHGGGKAPDRIPASDAARVPTERQFRTLMALGSGSALLTGTKRTVEPLLRHGWVTCDHGWNWTRITAEGLHALARAVAKYGLPEMTHGSYHEKACSECGRKWKPKCRCGSTSYRYESREVERAAA